MARRTKAEALETRERILDAAIEVFHARGVSRASLQEIAERAEVTRGAVYGHFKNKSDVFAAMTDRVSLPMEAMGDCARATRAGDPLGALRAQWVAFLQRVAADAQWQRILGVIFHRCELLESNGQILQRLQRGRATGLASMREFIAQAVARGDLPADLDVEVALHLFHGAVVGIIKEWLFAPESYDLGAQAERMVGALVEMLRGTTPLRRSPL